MSAAILLTCLLIIMGVLFDYFGSVQKKQLTDLCSLVAYGVEKEGIEYLDSYDGSCRVTLVSSDGTVLFDSSGSASEMENHSEREEILEASNYGFGESERYSDTVLEKTIYYAVKLNDGSIVRTAATQNSIWALLLGMMQPVCVILFLAIVAALLIANRVSEQIVRPLNNLDLEKPLENKTYEELSPLLTRIEHLHKNIDAQMTLLKQQRDEFSAITDGMSEGLVLLGNDSTVLSINRAAAELFGADKDCVGKSFLTVCRTTCIQDVISCAAGGKDGEITAEISGREYRFSTAPVITEGNVNGVCLLAVDVTDKIRAERMRREFTANVSHELKTPLHSIMGTAELLHNGLVAKEDVAHFTEMIMKESARLVELVNDIIRLSQLDEAQDLPKERVDLVLVAEDAVQTLNAAAKERGVTLGVHGEKAEITGVRTLLYEMVYNLCDNAIRYNVSGGSVDVYVENSGDAVTLRVCDTGIGIPTEHTSRVFERFYRVDKSRSRECGGTGLGLSIVKHAAEYHGAKLSLKSTVGEGTEVDIEF